MLKRRAALAAMGAGAWASPGLAEPSRLQWVAADLPPYAWQSQGQGMGYAHDLAVLMAQRQGLAQTVNFYPWARAVSMVNHGGQYGTFPLTRSPEREALYRWLIPLGNVEQCLFMRRASAHADRDAEAYLRHRGVAVLRGSPLVSALRQRGFTKVVECRGFSDMLRMLHEGLVEGAAGARRMLVAAMRQSGLERARFAMVGVLGESALYMAASTRLDDAEAQRWQAAYQLLVADGTVERLRKQYLND